MNEFSYVEVLKKNEDNLKSFLIDLNIMNGSFLDFLKEQDETFNISFRNFDDKDVIITEISNLLEAVSLRWKRLNFHLESYWSIVEKIQFGIFENTDEKSILTLSAVESELAVVFMENFLYNAKSFVDYILRLTCTVTERQRVDFMLTTKDVTKILDRTPSGKLVLAYINDCVFKKDEWGDWLKKLRDKVAHSTVLKPSLIKSEVLDFTFEWQSIGKVSVQKTLQNICNGCYSLTHFIYTDILNCSWRK